MAYVEEIDQVITILTNGMTTYATSCDYVSEIDTEYAPGGYTDDNIVILVKRMRWGAGHNSSDYWRVFEVIMENIVNPANHAASTETFEKAAKELEDIEFQYQGGASTVPHSVSIEPLTIDQLPNNMRSFRVMAFWSK